MAKNSKADKAKQALSDKIARAHARFNEAEAAVDADMSSLDQSDYYSDERRERREELEMAELALTEIRNS